ncbi:MAG: hypothetical protein GY710_19330 [Desulfobacteraceae bacterium]|nr:hypothetical protein [Desulfobacteraceae bacterium]
MELFKAGSIMRRTHVPDIKKRTQDQFIQFCDIYNSRRTARLTIADAYKTAAQEYYTTLVKSKRWHDTSKFNQKFGTILEIDYTGHVQYRDINYIFNTDIATLELHINDTISICCKQMSKKWLIRKIRSERSRALDCLKASDLRTLGNFLRHKDKRNTRRWEALDRYRSHNQQALEKITQMVNDLISLYDFSTQKTHFQSKQHKKAEKLSILSNANPKYSQRACSLSQRLSQLKTDMTISQARKKSRNPLVSSGMIQPSGPIVPIKVKVLPTFETRDQIVEDGQSQVEILEDSLKDLVCWKILYQAIDDEIDDIRRKKISSWEKKSKKSDHYRLKCINMEDALREGKLLTEKCIRDAKTQITPKLEERLCQLLWIVIKKPASVQRRTGRWASSGLTETMKAIMKKFKKALAADKEELRRKYPQFARKNEVKKYLTGGKYSTITTGKFSKLKNTNLQNMILEEDL